MIAGLPLPLTALPVNDTGTSTGLPAPSTMTTWSPP